MSGGSWPRKEAVSVSSKPGPRPQSFLLLLLAMGAAELVPGAGEAMGLAEVPSRLPHALGEAFGDRRSRCCCSAKDSLGEFRAEDEVEVRGDRRCSALDEATAEDSERCCLLRRSFSLSQSK